MRDENILEWHWGGGISAGQNSSVILLESFLGFFFFLAQIKTIMECDFTHTRITITKMTDNGKDADTLDSSYIAVGNIKWWSHPENSMVVHENIKKSYIIKYFHF